jgi:fibronectin-binding autotransporter adhesin
MGGEWGIAINGGAGTVVNDGSIAGTDTNGSGTYVIGVYVRSGGSVTNATSASITAADWGVAINGGAGTVVNDGSIVGAAKDGVYLDSGGSVTNAASASIQGADHGIFLILDTGTVVNDGSIAGTGANGIGVYVSSDPTISPASVTNATSASITGAALGVDLSAGGTLRNAGSIIGGGGTAVTLGGFGDNLLVLDPGFGFSGLVTGGVSASNTLELASAASAGTVTGLGTQFTNFGPIVFDTGAEWSIAGNTSGLAGTISGFALGDTIEVTGVTAIGSSYVGGVLTLDEAVGSATLNLPGTFSSTTNFNVTSNSGGTEVTVACFRAGTRILTLSGEVAVEQLCVGDCVQLAEAAGPPRWSGSAIAASRAAGIPTRPRSGRSASPPARSAAVGRRGSYGCRPIMPCSSTAS